MSDGLLSFCKACTKKRVAGHRSENLDKVRAYDRDRSKLEHRIKKIASVAKRYREIHPKRYRANTALNNAKRSGKIKQGPCEVCGSGKSVAHHCDYNKPLDVMWLCQVHHKEWHKNNEPII